MSVTRQSGGNAEPWQRKNKTLMPIGFIPALFSGGDSRITTDPHTGLNKYLCPPGPAPDLVCASSCTASPVSIQGFNRAAEAFSAIASSPSPRQRADRLATLTAQIEARLLRYFGAGSLARAFLCPSGTDALLTTAMLLAAERPGEAVTAILPSASETGTGVPLAAVGRAFDGPDSGRSLTGCAANTVEIPFRSPDGAPLCDGVVNDAFAAASAAASGHAIVYLTHSTKTGLIGPVSPPPGTDVVVDACQARIQPATVVSYLRRGWPVVVTGSKFFGGPAFSGAVLFPHARLHANRTLPFALSDSARLGAALRWSASLAVLDAFESLEQHQPDWNSPADKVARTNNELERADFSSQPENALEQHQPDWNSPADKVARTNNEPERADFSSQPENALAGGMAEMLANRAVAIEQGLASNPALVPVGGLRVNAASGWAGLPSIFTFGVRDPIDRRRILSATELQPLYRRLACLGVLLGQPVSLGSFGGLRIAIGARDLLDGLGNAGLGNAGPDNDARRGDTGLVRIFAALEEATAPSQPFGEGR